VEVRASEPLVSSRLLAEPTDRKDASDLRAAAAGVGGGG
jgi:hypothetical protein